MRVNNMKAILKNAVRSAAVLLLGAGLASAQQQVNLSAGPALANLPDGASVHMWGYTCGTTVGGSTATCANTQPSGWSPVVITVPTGQDLQINLTNNLTFGANKIPTSIVIVGQIGGGLGDTSKRTTSPSPVHENQGTSWPIANAGPAFTPPSQADRVQSFSTEVPAGAMTSLTWKAPAPGTYLLESGTHPSIQGAMGLIGMVVVTTAPTNSTTPGTAYPAVIYNADVPLIFSEIDPVQNNAVDRAVNTAGFNESATHNYLTAGGVASINLTSPGSGYTAAPTVTFSPAGATAHTQIDTDSTSPTYGQVTEIDLDTVGNYTSAPTISIAGPGGSGTAATASVMALALSANGAALCQFNSGGSVQQAGACYPSVVNYSPRYYLINGQGFDRFQSNASLFATSPASGLTPGTGSVLVRMVNAGLRMHVPSIVGSQIGTGTTPPSGFSLIAEDGNVLPGKPRVQSEVFMAAGKTYDVMINVPAAGSLALPVFDRELSLSANSANRDSGMVGYISANGAVAPFGNPSTAGAAAADDPYQIYSDVPYTVTDASKGVLANDTNVYNAKVSVAPTKGALSLNLDGTFTYTPSNTPSAWTGDSFKYCGNGGSPCATVTLSVLTKEDPTAVACVDSTFTSNLAKTYKSSAPGVLANCLNDHNGFPLSVSQATGKTPVGAGGLSVTVDPNGSFRATAPGPGTYTFSFFAQNSQGVVAANSNTVTVKFPQGSGLTVTVLDGADKSITIGDYRWILEEDRTFYVDPKCALNPKGTDSTGATCPNQVVNFGTNFHTSFMPVIATGCTGDISCGNNQTILGTQVAQKGFSAPGDVPVCSDPLVTPVSGQPPVVGCLDPSKRYYVSVLPGDAAQPFIAGYASTPTDCAKNSSGDSTTWTGNCGHGMGGAPIAKLALNGSYSGQTVTVITEPSPYPPATLTVFVFEDDFPLNGEHDAGGGIDILSPNEPGLGGFQITLQDDAGGTGDATGTPTYDMFNMPLSNSLAGTVDPTTGVDACPLSPQVTNNMSGDGTQKGIVGMIITCPTYEADGKTLSPLAGQAVVKNLWAGRYGVVAQPGADRFARGEEWLQTNTLDGQKAHDSFMRIGEPGYFQEFGPAGYHVTIGFANPKIINARGAAMCANPPTGVTNYCGHEVTGHITTARMSRTPDERLYGSGTHDSYAFTQCYVSIGDPDGEEFGFTKCDADGNFDFKNVPAGNWKITTFDQWNDQVVDGITTPVGMCDPQSSIIPSNPTGCKALVQMGEVAVHQWQSDIATRTFLDTDYSGVSDDSKPGLPLVVTNIRFRDGSYSNFNSTDLNGFAGFNEVFPLFNWYVIETDSTRYKNTGTHVVYDAGGPVDGSSPNGTACANASLTDPSAPKRCGNSAIAANLANTYEANPLPAELSLPGSVYCGNADCTAELTPNTSGAAGISAGPVPSSTDKHSTSRIDAAWVNSYGWQGYSGQNNFLEFGKRPFMAGENGGVHGHVVYASTRPFDDPQMLLQLSWEPLVPHVTLNLYQETLAADGITKVLKLVDHTQTTSFDDWAQGFRQNPDGSFVTDASGNYIPNMNCPGQMDASDPFYFGLASQPSYLDLYANPSSPKTISNSARYKCYDGMHNWNQLQPAPYDGMYSFPSVVAMDPTTGKPAGSGSTNGAPGSLPGTNCTICVANPSSSTANPSDPSYDPFRAGTPMLPAGKYVVEVVVPQGYELVKEEDKNILIGDKFIAPVTQQFGGLGSIFILPDQAEVSNPNNPQNSTDGLGRDPSLPSHEGDTGSVETYWPCVGEMRTVPDFISLFPGSAEVAPFAGAVRPLCDRKEVTLTDQTSALAKFYVFTETHMASHYTGVITDDFTAEFDPFSPQFGEKFGPAYLPVSWKDWAGNEVSRVYSDAWGAYNGLNYSTWEVNPPNPTGYGPTMMVGCMNDAGPIADGKGGQMTDPLYQDGYSQFCYELPFMPAQTGYFDTPVVPTSAFAGSYNPPDCAYPDATPAIAEVDGDGVGPWVGGANGAGALSAVSLTANGSGYHTAPTVGITTSTGTGHVNATATSIISGSVTAINFNPATGAGNGYTSTPAVNLEGGGGNGATAKATITGYVSSATVTAGGTGYTTRPTVAFSGGGGSGAAGTAVISGSVTTVTINNAGRGYVNVPTVTFNNGGTGGAGATATANTTGYISAVTVTNSGQGSYTAGGAPTVTFDPPAAGGTTATGTANMAGTGTTRRVSSVNITNAGSGYSGTVNVHFSSGNARATGTVRLTVVSVTVTHGGSGYNTAPGVSFTNAPFGGTRATGAAHVTGVVIGVNITANGSGYTSAPVISLTGGGGNGATASANLLSKLTSITLLTPGSGYTTAPQVQIVPLDGNGSGAAATSTITGTVVAVVLDNPGAGYGAAPGVTFSGGGGTGAAATASLSNGKLVITALGDQQVDNYEYSGPLATGNFSKLRVTRHYGFGITQGTGTVKIGDVVAPVTSWSDTSITVSVPSGVPACAIQQQSIYGGSAAKCGQLSITAGNGKQSIDSVTVTLGGKSPTHVSASSTIQAAIDAAAPGDLIMVDPAHHQEMLLMWKPVRLQGVGAASSIIDANPHPAGKLDPWRREVVCLFGLALNGQSYPKTQSGGNNPFDATNTFTCPGNLQHFSGGPNYPTMVVDRVPMEGILGWDTTVNGNLAEQLIEPSLMGAYEGAGISVLAKGVKIPAGATDVFGSGSESAFPAGSTLLTSSDCSTGPSGTDIVYPSNFHCNPSSIDGLTVKNSSQGGGGIYVHAWAHNLQIANNRVLNNQGTMSGGITIGQGEHTDVPLEGGNAAATTVPPGSCIPDTGSPANLALPYCYNLDVNVHNNMVSQNSSLGDELFSSTPAGAGGVTFCNGADYYKFDYNWVCGNMSTGDGAGVAHVGFSYYGSIEHNTIMFNQTTNPSITTNGGGLLVMGAPDPDPPCATNDQDCLSPANSITPSDGTGPGLLINGNYLVGNSADAGSGGGLRFQNVNGTDVVNFPNGNPTRAVGWPTFDGHAVPSFQANTPWNAIEVVNNIIANNVAGWDGGGISLQDALDVNIINNTIVSNNTTASSGILFQTLFAPLASTDPNNPSGATNNCTTGTQSCPQPAGLVSVTNSAVFSANLPSTITCPAGHGAGGTGTSHLINANCRSYSVPELYNDLFWQNRSLIIGVGGNAGGLQNQQNMITLYDPGFTASGLNPTQITQNQVSTGDCKNGPFSYWDLGVRGDTRPGNHTGGQLAPFYSVLTNSGALDEGTAGTNNQYPGATLPVTNTYCNGSRVPPESGGSNWQVPPGTNESNALPFPPFSLTAGGTVDEGNNWINLTWGPLALSIPDATNPYSLDAHPQPPAVDKVPSTTAEYTAAPSNDFYGALRKQNNNAVDIGAVEFVAPNFPIVSVSPTSLTFSSTVVGSTATAQTLTLSNTGGANFPGVTLVFSGPFTRATGGQGGAGTCAGTLNAGATCTINVVFTPTAPGAATGSLTIAGTGATVTGSPVGLSGTGAAAVRSFTATPNPLAFGNVHTGSTSTLGVTVTNTGNVALAGGSFTGLSGVFTHPAGGAGGNCGTTLAIGASCTYNVRFAPGTNTTTSFSETLTIGFTGATSVGVNVTGHGTAARATVTITPNPLLITLPTGQLSGTSTVTLTNSAASAAVVNVTGVNVSGLSIIPAWAFNAVAGQDNCSGSTLLPGQSCTVGVRFTSVGRSATTRTGSIAFTDDATGSPQSGVLQGVAP